MTVWKPLFGSKLKLARAHAHIGEFESLFESYVCDTPYRMDIDKKPKGGGIVLRPVLEGGLPSHTSSIIGDAIHNLRTSLDHLATDMVRASGSQPNRYTGFPIYDDEPSFNGGIASKLRGADLKFVDFVRSLKPYRMFGNAWFQDLSRLDNDDKHLSLVGSSPAVTIAKVDITVDWGGGEWNQAVVEGVRIAGGEVHLFPGGQVTKLEIDERLAFSVIFGEGTSLDGALVGETLRDLHAKVSGVVNDAAILF